MACGINVFADLGGRYPQVSSEEVVRRNPSCIPGHTGHQLALTPAQISQQPGWNSMTAVKQHCIRLLNGDTVARPGPHGRSPGSHHQGTLPDLLPSAVTRKVLGNVVYSWA